LVSSTSRAIQAAYFIPSTSLTTTLSTTEPALVPGVSMRAGDTYREGGELPEDSTHMSRKAYTQKIAMSGSKVIEAGSSLDLNKSSFEGIDAGPSTATFGAASGIGATESFEALPMSMSLLSSKMLSDDLDPFEGSRKVSRATDGIKKKSSLA
jgi:hypothetical protein